MVIEGDITDADKVNELGQYDFEKIINCAACAKHFSADDTLEIVNYQGVLNLIHLCGETGRELIQISAVSVAGENVREKIPKEKKLHENELDFGQNISNKYIDTKFRAEKAGHQSRQLNEPLQQRRVSDKFRYQWLYAHPTGVCGSWQVPCIRTGYACGIFTH